MLLFGIPDKWEDLHVVDLFHLSGFDCSSCSSSSRASSVVLCKTLSPS